MTAIALRRDLSSLFACDRQDYYAELLAAGLSEEEARRHEQANALQRFRNRDAYMEQEAA